MRARGAGMPGDYQERLKEVEAWIARARTPDERKAYEAIAAIWRKLADAAPPKLPPEPKKPKRR